MKRAMMMALVLTGAGCEKLQDIQETVEGVTERFVVEGIYLGVESPEGIDLSETAFAGAKLTAFLADASQISEIESAPIENTALMLMSDGNGGNMPMLDVGSGKYELSHEDGLEYVSSEFITLSSSYGSVDRAISVIAPPAAELDIDPDHAAGSPMLIDLSGQGFDAALAMVFDVETGEVTWSNEPQDISELYDMTHPNGFGLEEADDSDALMLEIPAMAFAEESYYIVGVAGMVVADAADFTNVNTALSTLMAGKLRFTDVCTEDFLLLLCDE